MTPSQRNILRQFNPRRLFAGGLVGGFWDVSDRKTLWQNAAMTTPVAADGDPVGAVMDKSGNGNHLLQVGADATRPTYKTSGGLHWLEGDGTADYLRAVFTITLPWDRVSAMQQISWTLNDRLLGGGNAVAGVLFQTGTTPTIGIHNGITLPTTTGAAVGVNVVITERQVAASSRIAINNAAYSAAANGGSTAPGGVTLFANSDAGNPGNCRWYGMVMIQGTLAETQIIRLRRYFAARAGIAL
jgi:hypothetical protein